MTSSNERVPERCTRVDDAVARIRERCGNGLRLATPLGIGKPNVLLNALYRAATTDPGLFLQIYTALSLLRPVAKSDLERRFLAPFARRQFGDDYPDLAYAAARRDGTLPPNVRVSEFYLPSGSLLHNDDAQRDYASENYTHVARDLADVGINVVVQLVARRGDGAAARYSLAGNPDVTLDLLDEVAWRGRPRPYIVGVVHPRLPYIGNEAEVAASWFDLVLDDPACDHTLFALPREPVALAEYALGLHASTLVRDGGTLQIGIGALSDALVHALLMRHRRNADYREVIDALGAATPLVTRLGGLETFGRGLYGASEMVMDGFMHLVRGGVVRRRVFDDRRLESALADGLVGETLQAGDVDRLHAAGVLPERVDAHELARLVRFGLLPDGARLDGARLVLPDGTELPAGLASPDARAAWDAVVDGRRLASGRYLRGAFFLGSSPFYDWLRGLEGDAFDALSMTRVSDINQLYGGREELDALQRRDARFFNTCMMATALGAAVSDALDDGRVVSGVGGQYNFVAMAHALRDGRSVLMLRAARGGDGGGESNVLWNYGHTTIPRHLRDIYVTEYGVADLRGRSDQECVQAMLAISDARFIDALVARARGAGKLAHDFTVPDRWRENTPAKLRAQLAPFVRRGLFETFPFGSDFTAEERRLVPALQWLKRQSAGTVGKVGLLVRAAFAGAPRDDERAALARLGLGAGQSEHRWLPERLVMAALKATRTAA